MDEIPEDIELAATLALDAILASDSQYANVEIIARAILAERKRCAEIARTTYAKDAFHYELGTAVAERIESGQ